MRESLIGDMLDENSDWNTRRKALETEFMRAGTALLAHTLATRIELTEFGAHAVLELEEAVAVN